MHRYQLSYRVGGDIICATTSWQQVEGHVRCAITRAVHSVITFMESVEVDFSIGRLQICISVILACV